MGFFNNSEAGSNAKGAPIAWGDDMTSNWDPSVMTNHNGIQSIKLGQSMMGMIGLKGANHDKAAENSKVYQGSKIQELFKLAEDENPFDDEFSKVYDTDKNFS